MEISLLQALLLLLLLFSIYLCCYIHNKSSRKKPITYIGFKNYSVLGAVPDLLRNRNRFLDWTTDVLAQCPTQTITYSRPINVRGVITANPLNVEHMLKTNFENYPKGEQCTNVLKDFLGQGIFNSDDDAWKVQRKAASYEFNTSSLRNFAMNKLGIDITTKLIPCLATISEGEEVLDLQDILERFSFDSTCKVAFNVDPGCFTKEGNSVEIMGAFEDAALYSSGRFLYGFRFLWKIKRFFNMGSERALKRSIEMVHEFTDHVIRSRMEDNKTDQEQEREDFLARFLKAAENSPEFLRDMVLSFIIAGRDTATSVLVRLFWHLAQNGDVERKIVEELKTIRAKRGSNIGDAFSVDELREMQYLQAVISEALRLYPPIPVDSKVAQKEDILPDGTFVGKGWLVTYHTYAMGRMEPLWGRDCQEYLPERWLDENGMCRQESPFRYPVFHAGPRTCLGKDMAQIQMKSIAASIIESFEVDVQDKSKCPEHVLSLILKMKGGLLVRVRRRVY